MSKKYVTLLLIIIPFILFAKHTVSLEINKNGKIFKITKFDSLYSPNDSVEIKLEIINNSNVNFYILDFEVLRPEPIVYEKKERIYFNIGGTFNAQLNLFHKLKLLKPKEKFEYNFCIHLNKIGIKYEKKRNNYVFYVSLGYYDYSEDFKYLTQSKSDGVPIKSSADVSKLTSYHNEVILGYLPFPVLK